MADGQGRRAVATWARARRVSALQTVKTAGAAMLAWEAARLLLDADTPVFAPLTAMLVVQVTVRASVRNAVERVAGVVAGVLVALLLARAFGLTWWSIGLLVAGGLLVGRLARLGPQGAVQVPVSALLVLVIGTQTDLAVARVEDTLLGALIGVLVNVLVAPPVSLAPAQRAAADLAEQLAALATVLADGVTRPFDAPTARSWLLTSRLLPDGLDRARDALDGAADSLRFNPRRSRLDVRVDRLRVVLTALDHVVTQLRGTSRTLFELARDTTGPAGLPPSYAVALDEIATALHAYGAVVRDDGVPGPGLVGALDRARECLQDAVSAGPAGDDWLALGSVLSDLTRLLRELDPSGPHAAALREPEQHQARTQ